MANDDWSSWKQQNWAQREAVKKEFLWHHLVHTWKDRRRQYLADPEGYTKKIKRTIEERFKSITDEINRGTIIDAAASDDTDLQKMHDIVKQMSLAFAPNATPPTLLIHTIKSPMPWVVHDQIQVNPVFSNVIQMNTFALDYFLKYPDRFKVAIAHEMAHLINGDTEAKGIIKNITHPQNQSEEILADRLAAIIHGNPREYAKSMSDEHFAHSPPDKHHVGYQDYPSANFNARMYHKWAEILEREGATDHDGNVILDKALPIYHRTKEITQARVKWAQDLQL